MTVAELIEELKTLPKDAKVVIYQTHQYETNEVDLVEYVESKHIVELN